MNPPNPFDDVVPFTNSANRDCSGQCIYKKCNDDSECGSGGTGTSYVYCSNTAMIPNYICNWIYRFNISFIH